MLVALWGEEDSMKGRFIPLIAAVVAALAVAAPSAAAPAAGTSVAIERQATLVTSAQLVVRVAVQCPAGTMEQIQVGVSQQQPIGPNTDGFGFMNTMCDGSKQSVSVLVDGGPFTLGQAFATARGVSFSLTTLAQNERVIDIS
jgi:hypothetical protein